MYSILTTIIEHTVQIISACCIYIAARWLLGISTPQKDIAEIQSWRIFQFDRAFYRGSEYMHQVRARNILERAFSDTQEQPQ